MEAKCPREAQVSLWEWKAHCDVCLDTHLNFLFVFALTMTGFMRTSSVMFHLRPVYRKTPTLFGSLFNCNFINILRFLCHS